MSKDNKEGKGGIFQAIKEFVYGVAAHDSARFALKTRASMEHLFILITMGDMLGYPFCPLLFPEALTVRGPADLHLEAQDAPGKRPDRRPGMNQTGKGGTSDAAVFPVQASAPGKDRV